MVNGLNTHYLGRLDVAPALNPAEVEWLRAYRLTNRDCHPDDPYAVPMHPAAEWLQPPQSGATAGWGGARRSVTGLRRCDWEPCLTGCCLGWREAEKSNNAEVELAYLIDHFLRPGAQARLDGRPDFAQFTFDHVVNGIVAAERNDTRELFLIVATDNELSTQVLVPETPCHGTWRLSAHHDASPRRYDAQHEDDGDHRRRAPARRQGSGGGQRPHIG